MYLVKDSDGGASPHQSTQDTTTVTAKTSGTSNGMSGRSSSSANNSLMVLKVTSIHSRQQRDIAEKEAKLLSRLSHPSIIKMYDSCYRTAPAAVGVVASIVGSKERDTQSTSGKERPQHLILMEYCEGGHALDVCTKLANAGQRFDLSALIIAFGQICNAVSYLHAQRPPIVHRDLKPVNFLVKNGAYKLCDFGSAIFGHVELKTPKARMEAEEVIQKTTTQMFRAPEMVDLYMAKKLTQRSVEWLASWWCDDFFLCLSFSFRRLVRMFGRWVVAYTRWHFCRTVSKRDQILQFCHETIKYRRTIHTAKD